MSKPLLFAIVGAFTGLIVTQLSIYIDINEIEIALFAFTLFIISFTLLWGKIPNANSIKFLTLLGIVLTGITIYFFSQNYNEIRRSSIQPTFVFGLIQLTIISTTFFQSWKSSKPRYNYEDLFENAWNNHFYYLFSGLLMGLFLLILGLGSALFDMVGIKISRLIWNENITPVIVGALLGIGVGISREYDELIFKVRSIFFALFKVLAYLTAAILILFTLVLPFTVNSLFANKNTSLILLSIVAVSIVLLNALKDTEFSKFPKLAKNIFNTQIVLLPILTALSIYAIYLRIEQYGLMPNRIIALWTAILIGSYALGYLIQLIINKGHWNLGFAKVNPSLAFFWVISIILLASPLLDPVKLSVNNQVERLESGKVSPDEFDFGSLKKRLGEPGKLAIKNISSWKDHPQNALIQKKLTEKSERRNVNNKKPVFNLIGEAPKKLNQLKSKYRYWNCKKDLPCFVKLISLGTDLNKQPMVFSFKIFSKSNSYQLRSDYYEYNNKKEGWTKVTSFLSNKFEYARLKEVIESIKTEDRELIAPKYSDFTIDGIEFRQ